MDVDLGNGKVMKVRFKDYGFFVPKDIKGKQVVFEGMAYSEVVPVDELRHFAEDAGKSDAEINRISKPEKQVRFIAAGVSILN